MFRAEEVGASPGPHPLAVLLKELRMHERSIELPLEVLGEASVAAYLRARFRGHDFPREFSTILLQKTRGHPLLFSRLLSRSTPRFCRSTT